MPNHNNLLEVMPILESVIGKFTPNTHTMLTEIFEQKQISTAGILRILPMKNKGGTTFSTTLAALTKIFNQYGVVVKYVTSQSVSYSQSNGLTITQNPQSIVSSPELPKSLTGLIVRKRRLVEEQRNDETVIDFGKMEELTKTYIEEEERKPSLDLFSPQADWYLDSITKHKLLTKEKTYQLVCEAREGNFQARNVLMLHNQKLIVHIAYRIYRGSYMDIGAMEFSDLVQEGNFGLCKAVERFDTSLGFHFSTYAYWWIEQSIQRVIQENRFTVRLPVHIHEKLSKLRKVSHLVGDDILEVAEKMGITEKEVWHLRHLDFTKETSSLDFPLFGKDDETVSLSDVIEDAGSVLPPLLIDRKILKEKIRKCLKTNLGIREYDIIEKRFGLGDSKPLKLREIGEIFGVTRERIRQIEVKAMEKIKGDFTLRTFAEEYLGKEPKEATINPSDDVVALQQDASTGRQDLRAIQTTMDTSLIAETTRLVAKFYGVSEEKMYEKADGQDILRAHHIALYILWKNYNVSFGSIAKKFGYENQNTIRQICLKVHEEVLEGKSLSKDIAFISEIKHS